MNASKYIFSSINIKWRFFHLTNSIRRHGVYNRIGYTNNSNSALELRKLAALAYVPENSVISAFESLLQDSESYTEKM